MNYFTTLMMIFVALIIVNIILTFILWQSNKSEHLKILFLHWIFLLVIFLLQTVTVSFSMKMRMLSHIVPNFLLHYTLVLVFSKMVRIKLPLRFFIFMQIVAFVATFVLDFFNLSDQLISVPVVFAHAFLYLYVTFFAFKNRFRKMTYSLKIITFVLLSYGIHIFSYSYFSVNPDLLVLGFGFALVIHMAIAILLPAAIIELMTIENSKLKSEMQLRATLIQSSRMAALGEMAGGVAHEINNPLMVLSLSLNVLRKQAVNENLMQLLPKIEKSQMTIQRIVKIVKSLLAFTRQMTPVFEEVNARELIEDTLLLCSEKFKHHNIDLKLNIPKEDILFQGERILLSQVILNLITNAFDAIQDLETKWINIEVQNKDDEVVFSVSDSGKIVDEEVREKMFEPFFTTKDVDKGSGLGLSVAKGIIQSHYGSIWVNYTPNTKFTFNVPKKLKERPVYSHRPPI